ncbi:MAG: hypothetical protein KC777_22720 [Cyanobacteria bacterium HKST-UBA02]|nr:hypothetical protein [Cyanobacteria bacterium HKST-UBA02]
MAFALDIVLPMLPGISFHGNFLHAIGAAAFFTIIIWLVEVAAVFVSTLLTISTFGLALLFIVPIWIMGFFLLPVLALKMLAGLLPGYLTIHGWLPALWGGLVMFLVGVVTGEHPKVYASKDK